MIKVAIEPEKFLIVDIPHLTKRENETISYKMAGKSTETTAMIMGISKGTAKEHCNSSYKKTGVSGSENPFALLQSKAFLNNWVRMAVIVLTLFHSGPRPSAQSNGRPSIARTGGRREQDFTTMYALG